MSSVCRWLLLVLAAGQAVLSIPASAQPNEPANAEVRIDGFDVEQVPRLTPGMSLVFSLYGTPRSLATIRINGARNALQLLEVEPGMYAGSYLIDHADRIGPESTATAILQRGSQSARALLEEPLQLGAAAPAVARAAPGPEPAAAPRVGLAAAETWTPPPVSQRVGTPVPSRVAAAPGCANCALVEAVRTVRLEDAAPPAEPKPRGLWGALVERHELHKAWLGRVLGGAPGEGAVPRAGARTGYDVVLRLPDGRARTYRFQSPPPFETGATVRLRDADSPDLGRPGPAFRAVVSP